jgi:hypothetical protein
MISPEERRDAEDRIARLIFGYCSRLDAADFEGMASLFEHGTWHIDPETVCHGKAEVRAWLEQNLIVHGDKLGTRHIISNIVTEVTDDGQTAVSSSYVHVTQVNRGLPAPAALPSSLPGQLRQDQRRMAPRRPEGPH